MGGNVSTSTILETAYAVDTPEGVSLELSPAGVVVRGLAFGIDFLIRVVIYVVVVVLLSATGKFGEGLFLLMLFLLEWFYPVIFEVYRQGQTPGKKVMAIKVLQDNGIPVGWTTSLIRNLLRAVDFLPMMYGFGVVSMLIAQNFRRLGDLAAGTLVVYVEPTGQKINLPRVHPRPPPVALSLVEQRAVLAFAERAPRLSQARAEELANLMEPLTQEKGHNGITRLYEIANWLRGTR